MPRGFVDDFIHGLLEYAREFAQERIDEVVPKPPRQPRRKNIRPSKIKTPKTPKPAKREAQGPTLYDQLEVSQRASQETIRAAYLSLSKRFHPDVAKFPNAAARMKLINAAHEVIGDPTKRKAYDAELRKQ